MQFIEGTISLSVSELNTKEKVGVTMEDIDNEPYAYFIELDGFDIKRLIDWLQLSLDAINNPST